MRIYRGTRRRVSVIKDYMLSMSGRGIPPAFRSDDVILTLSEWQTHYGKEMINVS